MPRSLQAPFTHTDVQLPNLLAVHLSALAATLVGGLDMDQPLDEETGKYAWFRVNCVLILCAAGFWCRAAS